MKGWHWTPAKSRALRGQPAQVPISGKNARRAVFGAFHLRTGHLVCLDQTRKRALEFQEFLDFVRRHYRAGPVALLLDENPACRCPVRRITL